MMAFDPATVIPDLSQKTFLITGGEAFTDSHLLSSKLSQLSTAQLLAHLLTLDHL